MRPSACLRVVSLFLCALLATVAAARQPDSETDLLAHIGQEQNPVKKSKYQTRLGHVKLLQALQAGEKGDMEKCQRLLNDYLKRVQESWQTLQGSGRRAERQPQGFKELDIELREDTRLLTDLKRRVSYFDRDPIEKDAQEVEKLRAEVLHALFPADRPAKGENDFVCLRAPGDFAGEYPPWRA